MALPLARTRVTIPDHVITRVVGSSTVILDVNSGRSFTLDAVGSRVWTLLAATGSAQATLDRLQQEFEADPRQLEQDLEQLLSQLAGGSLLELSEASA